MRNLGGSRVLSAAIVVIAVGGLYALAGLRHPIPVSGGVPPRAPHSVAVTSVIRACPAPGASRGGGIAVMAAPASAAAGQASPGHGVALVNRLAGLGSTAPGRRSSASPSPACHGWPP